MTAAVLPLFGAEAPQPAFERFWAAYPKRQGPNPKKSARQAWERLIRAGHDPERIIRACEAWAVDTDHGTPYVPHAATWLNQERFNDILEERERDQVDRIDRTAARKQTMAECIKRCRRGGLRVPGHITAEDVAMLEREGYL